MENADRAVGRFRRPVAFGGLVDGQTRDVRLVDEPTDWIEKQFPVVLRNDQSGSVASEQSNSQPFRRRSRKTFTTGLDLHWMSFAIARWINGFQDGKQLSTDRSTCSSLCHRATSLGHHVRHGENRHQPQPSWTPKQ